MTSTAEGFGHPLKKVDSSHRGHLQGKVKIASSSCAAVAVGPFHKKMSGGGRI